MAKFKIRELQTQHVMTIRATASKEQIGAKFGELLPAVFAYVGSHGGQPAGAPFARYHNTDEKALDFEVGVPVAKPIAGEGRIKAGTLPAGKAAVTWHVGPYDQLHDAHQAIKAWIKEQGLTPAGAPWEVYWTDPTQEPDSSKWKTEIIWPVKTSAAPAN